jgi:hypothetical protein
MSYSRSAMTKGEVLEMGLRRLRAACAGQGLVDDVSEVQPARG